jgi:hypothetical protein
MGELIDMGEYQHRCAAGACEELAQNIETELEKLASEPIRLEGEARALKTASGVLEKRFLERAKAEHRAGKLSDAEWKHVHMYVRGCVGQLAVLAKEVSEIRKPRAEGQLLGMRNSLKIARGHTEHHRNLEKLAADGEDVFGEAEKEFAAEAELVEEVEAAEPPKEAAEPPKDDVLIDPELAELQEKKYKELRKMAKEMGLQIGGNKTILANRIYEARQEVA